MRHLIEYAAVAGARGLTRLLPDAAVRALGSSVGVLVYHVDRPHRRVALANLAQCFPGKSDAEHQAIAREMFAHFGRLLFEILKFSTLRPDQMLARVEFEGLE
ncbi:MAG: lysophospholipid acyltransferase family protein, partial [Vicinamibacteria bacterium]